MQKSGLLNYYKKTGTNGINNFDYKKFSKMEIEITSNKRILSYFRLFRREINLIIKNNILLKNVQKLLLPRLMSGKLKV